MEEMDVGDVATPGEDEERENAKVKDLKVDEKGDVEDESQIEDGEKVSEDEESEPEESEKDEEDLDDDDEDDADEAEVKIFEARLAQNPYEYDSHVSLISKFQKMGELERLRAARENMSSKYPLSPELWKSWIQDEIKLAITEDEKNAVVALCERAVHDYLSVELWLEYLQFSIGNMGSEKDAAKNVRQLFERALTAASGHITKGAIIWEAFREFENVLVSMVDPSKPAERKEQIDRVGKLFTRQLKVPLLDMEKTFEEYESWRSGEGAEATIDQENLISSYEAAYKKLNDRLPFEEKLVSAQNESELIDSYNAYLMYERKYVGDPGRITVLYERALAELSLQASLWLDYVTYLESELKIEEVLDPVFKRAVRNVPWCSQIWEKRIRAYERWKKPVLEVQHVFEEALQAGFNTAEEYRNLWVLYLEFLRRRIDLVDDDEDERDKQLETLRNTFNRACEYLAKTFGLEGDPNCVILQFWARTEAIHAKDMEKARALWTDILSQGHNAKAASWLEYISLERCYGTTKHLRKLYPKALLVVKDWPESISNAWLDFERDEGTLEQMEICEAKIKERLAKVNDERQKSQGFSNPVDVFAQSRKMGKRKAEETGKMRKGLGISPKKMSRMVLSEKPKQKLRESVLKLDKKEKMEEGTSEIEPPPGFKEDERMEEDLTPEVDDKISIFVSNLDYTATEEEVREALAPAGPITLFKMVRDAKGRSKGFCYVQLSSAEAVEAALKLDRTKINGRPMFVSRCDPNKSTRGHAFKYKCGLEKNKLYIKGLPPSITREELEGIFQPYGTVTDIRIPVYRNGHAKGMAYVDFEDEASASKALIATDGMEIKDKPISVMISNPKERKKDSSKDDHRIKSLGGHPGTKSFSHPKSALSMVPTTVLLNSASNGNPSKPTEEIKPKTNKDFKDMFLKK